MTTTDVLSNTQTATGKATSNPKAQLQVDDFINLMVTQLQNQDPTSPASNSELLQQMSQIGQLQSQNSLQTSLKDLVLQNNIGSASSMIGKAVEGIDQSTGESVSGKVNGITVAKGSVILKLDTGATLPMSSVSSIENAGGSADADLSQAIAKSAGAAAAAG